MKELSKKKPFMSAVIGLPVAIIAYYLALPALNVHSYGFWLYLTAVIAAFSTPWIISAAKGIVLEVKISKQARIAPKIALARPTVIVLISIALPLTIITVQRMRAAVTL
jgi:hypothetical protein